MNNIENEDSKKVNDQIIDDLEDQKESSNDSEDVSDLDSVDDVDDEDLEDDDKLPFPNARVVRLMRENLDSNKQIKGIVKKEMNIFLEKMLKIICKKMNAFDYSYVDYGMFKQAIETFENIQTIELEKIRLIKSLDKIKADCDSLIDDVERKFHK